MPTLAAQHGPFPPGWRLAGGGYRMRPDLTMAANRAFALFQSQGFTGPLDSAYQVVPFILEHALNRAAVGDWLGDVDNFGVRLAAFMPALLPTCLPLDAALRRLAATMAWPRDPTAMRSIVRAFANWYFRLHQRQANCRFIVNDDAVYSTTIGLVLLNVELHSPVLTGRARLTRERWVGNIRAATDDQQWPAGYLEGLYDSVAAEPLGTWASADRE